MDRRSKPLLRRITDSKEIKPKQWNRVVVHPLQTWEWGEFRKKTGLKIIRLGVFKNKKIIQGFQISIHKIPFTLWNIGYLAKCSLPSRQVLEELSNIGRENNCIFIQIEPHQISTRLPWPLPNLHKSIHPTFAQFNFVLDINKPESNLLTTMHPKTRYNIRVAQRHGVEVKEHIDQKGFEIFLKLYFETTQRQHYFGHTPCYHKLLWETLQPAGIARILIAYYSPQAGDKNCIPLTAWMTFHLNDTLYYPYGGSSDKYKNVMASNLVAWEAIRLGKKLGAEYLDLWGCLGPDANPKHPWYGFHRFKAGYGGKLVQYVNAYDLVLNPLLYQMFHLANKLRWIFLHLKPF